jgi:hypothetical protein
VLEYQVPRPVRRHYSPAIALMLCAPGAACWVVFLAGILLFQSPSALGELFWPLWLLAVASALVSLCLYVRFPFRPLSGPEKLNLFVNVSGLLFSALMLMSA